MTTATDANYQKAYNAYLEIVNAPTETNEHAIVTGKIDPGIHPLVEALNLRQDIHTYASCDGQHDGASPSAYVAFITIIETAQKLHAQLNQRYPLIHVNWRRQIIAIAQMEYGFNPAFDNALTFIIRFHVRQTHLWRSRRNNKIASMISEMTHLIRTM